MRRRLLLCTILLIACFQIGDSKIARVSFLKPIPHFVSEHDLIPYKVRIEPDPNNRLLRFLAVDRADGAEVSVSEEQLDGANAPITRTLWRQFPAGKLFVIAELWTADHIVGRAQIDVCVAGPDVECSEPEPAY